MTEEKTIRAATPQILNGQLVVVIVFTDGEWTLWAADSHKDVQAIINLVGSTVEFGTQTEMPISGTLH